MQLYRASLLRNQVALDEVDDVTEAKEVDAVSQAFLGIDLDDQ